MPSKECVKIEIKEHTPEELCQIGLKHKLFVQGKEWQMQHWFTSPSYIKEGRVAYVNGTPIGICVKNKSPYDYNIGVYVKKLFRRQGIGTKLAAGFTNILPCKNTKEQKMFWRTIDEISSVQTR